MRPVAPSDDKEPVSGKKRSKRARLLIGEAAVRRWASYTPERRQEVLDACHAGRRRYQQKNRKQPLRKDFCPSWVDEDFDEMGS